MGTGQDVSGEDQSFVEKKSSAQPPSGGHATSPPLTEHAPGVQKSGPERPKASPAGGLTTAEALLRGMRVGSVSALPAGSFPLHLYVIESDDHLLTPLMEIGRRMGFTVRGSGPGEVLQALDTLECDVVLLDLSGEAARLELLRHLRQTFPRVPILVTTAYATVQTAVEALRNGATDFLTKPFSMEELTATLHTAAEQRSFDVELRRMQQQVRTSPAMLELVTASAGMQKLMSMVARVALSDHPVMVLGEGGSGKERVARVLHAASQSVTARGGLQATQAPFLQVACGSSNASALEVELFGSVRSESGGLREHPGLLTIEGGGTLFLDEIDALPLELQSRLLRAMQERSVRIPGAATARPLTVRLIASSSRDLPALVDRGQFRKDLFFRLNVVNLRVPPLRQRREDLPILVAGMLEQHRERRGLPFSLGPDAMRVLLDYEWPGNVRELEAVIDRACTLSSGPVLHLADLPTQLHHMPAAEPEATRIDTRVSSRTAVTTGALPAGNTTPFEIGIVSIAEMERRMILLALEKLNGDKIMAAKMLGIGKTTLYRKLKEYGIGELAA